MLLIQQSTSFRLWTSRALMVYFRRALLFLVVSPRKSSIYQRFLTCERQQERKICFSDAEDDEETMINDQNDMKQPLISLQSDLSTENVITNPPGKSRSDQSLIIVDFTELPDRDQLKPSLDHSKTLAIKTTYQIENDDHSIERVSHFNCLDLILRSPVRPLEMKRHSPTHRLSLISHSGNCSSSSDDEDDIYEKYQTSFSHILHQGKSLNAIRQEDELHSILTLEPNTSIITVRSLASHSDNRNTLDYSIFTSHISVRLIAYRTDRAVHADAKPIGCRKKLKNGFSCLVNVK